MNYNMTTPCDQCPFLSVFRNTRVFSVQRLIQFAEGPFPCHKTANVEETEEGGSEFIARDSSIHCAGALIFMEKRGRSSQMMRIAERLGFYDRRKLNMEAKVR